MKLFVCGDTHSSIDIAKLTMKNWPEQAELTKEDIVCILGDFGFIWAKEQTKEELYWLDWLKNKTFTTCFIDGNHENFNRLEQYPVESKWGGSVQKVHESVYHLMRGEIFTFGDSKVLTLGGAESIDKMWRTLGESWWTQERISEDDMKKTLDNLSEIDYYVDFILTHTCPSYLLHRMSDIEFKEHDTNSVALQRVLNMVNFREWHIGHWHKDFKIDNFFCHYNNKPRRLMV